jgi:chromosome segregation ATPase
MKNAFVALAFLLAISGTFAVQTATNARLSKIAATDFGKTILETIQVEMETSEDPRPKIIELLNELKDEALAAQQQADTDISRTREGCTSAIDEIKAVIGRLDQSLTDDNAELIEKRLRLEDRNAAEHGLSTTIGGFETELAGVEDARVHNQALFEEKDAKFQKILDVLRQVRTWIADRRDTRYQFLQQNQVVTAFAEVRSEEFLKLSPGFGRLINFLATKVENHLSQTPDEQADAGLNAIVAVIDDLITSFQEEKALNVQFNNDDIHSYEETKGRLEGEIAHNKGALSAIQAEIANLIQRIGELEGAIKSNGELLEGKKGELTLTEASCEEQEQAYQRTTADRNEELGIIQEVLDIVNNQLTGLREFTENYIANN